MRESLERVGGDEYEKWKAFYQLEPWGREWQRDAMLAATTVNAAGAYQDKPLEHDAFMHGAYTTPNLPPGFEEDEESIGGDADVQRMRYEMIEAMAKVKDAKKAKA